MIQRTPRAGQDHHQHLHTVMVSDKKGPESGRKTAHINFLTST